MDGIGSAAFLYALPKACRKVFPRGGLPSSAPLPPSGRARERGVEATSHRWGGGLREAVVP